MPHRVVGCLDIPGKIHDNMIGIRSKYNEQQEMWQPHAPTLPSAPKPEKAHGFWDWLRGCIGGPEDEDEIVSAPIIMEPDAPSTGLPGKGKVGKEKEPELHVAFKAVGEMKTDPHKGVYSAEFRARQRKEKKETERLAREARRHLPEHEIYMYPKDAKTHLVL